MIPRSMWKGNLRLNEMIVPVKLHAAVHEERIAFYLLHNRDYMRLQQQMVCALGKTLVPPDEQVSGFELEDGKYLLVEPGDLEKTLPAESRMIEVHEFVPAQQVEPVYFERAYYLEPEGRSPDYREIAAALADMNVPVVCAWTIRKRSYFGALGAAGGILRLHTLRRGDELIDVKKLDLPDIALSEKELSVAARLAGELTPAARRLHYDLRLEIDGVLKSWAIPKGPSQDPAIKRLAVMVEDHPLEYKDFEGAIPEDSYGAGNVIIWDRGFYYYPDNQKRDESEKRLIAGLKKGTVKFVLAGEKLRGKFAPPVKTGLDDKSWPLIKKRDAYSKAGVDVLARNRSVTFDKTPADITRDNPGISAPFKIIEQSLLKEAMEAAELKGAPVAPTLHKIKPMLATIIEKPFDDPAWLFEVKWDGFRALAEINKGRAILYSRNGITLNRRFPSIVQELKGLRFDAVLDGEIVVVDESGRADYQMLQNYRTVKKGHLVYYVFDLLYFEGHDLKALPLEKRKALLKKIVPSSDIVKFSDHVVKDGIAFFNAVRERGVEGVTGKHAQSAYRPGLRSREWLKMKTHMTQEAVIGGFTKPRGARKNIGALVLGVYEQGDLGFIGHAGGGLNTKMLESLRARLDVVIQNTSSFRGIPKTNTPVTWVKPMLVCEVVFQGWTDDGLMRQPVFLRMRDDKAPRDVTREG